MKKLAAVLVLALAMVGCPNKFMAARTAISAGRMAMGMARMVMDSVHSAKMEACAKEDPTKGDKYKSCVAKSEKRMEDLGKSEKVAKAGFDAAEAGVNLAEQTKGGQAIDWMTPLKRAACVVAECISLAPEEKRKKIQLYLDLMAGFGCGK